MKLFRRPEALSAIFLLLVSTSGLAGCFYSSKETVREKQPVASTVVVTPQPQQRVYTYPEGRYELHGEGTASSPYYWVWIPSGIQAVPTPPPPPIPTRSSR